MPRDPEPPLSGAASTTPLLSVHDVAELLNLTEATVRRLLRRGELEAFKISNQYRIAPEAVSQFLEQQRISTPAARDWSDFRLPRSA